MGRQAGEPKTGGRKKGTPNKNTLRLRDELERCGINPIQILKEELYKATSDTKVNTCVKLMGHLYPKPLQQIDIQQDLDFSTLDNDELIKLQVKLNLEFTSRELESDIALSRIDLDHFVHTSNQFTKAGYLGIRLKIDGRILNDEDVELIKLMNFRSF